MKIIITGANGYIGRNLLKLLSTADSSNIIYSISRSYIKEFKSYKNVHQISNDIFTLSKEDLEIIKDSDVCIHLAWQNGFNHQDSYHLTSVCKHLEFIKTLISVGVKNFAISGSMHEYGYHLGAILEHETPTQPRNPYGIAKDFLRRAIRNLCHEQNVGFQWLRIFYIYGDDINNQSIFNKLLLAAQEGKEYFPLNSGEFLYDFIHIDDLVFQIYQAIKQQKYMDIINCCSGNPISLKTMVEKFVYENNLEIKIKYNVFPEREYDSKAIWGQNDKIVNILKNIGS